LYDHHPISDWEEWDFIAQYEQLGAEIQAAYADDVSVMTDSLLGIVVVVFTIGEGGIYSKLEHNILAACSGSRVQTLFP
jgi:hypothetical protein